MLQFLAPLAGQLISQLFMPKAQTPQMSAMGNMAQMGLPGTMPMQQNSFDISSLLGGVLSMALGGGGQMSPFAMGGMGGMGGFGGGMGNPFATAGMMGGLGGFMNGTPASMLAFNGMGPTMPQSMAATNQLVDMLNSDGQAQYADANAPIMDSAS